MPEYLSPGVYIEEISGLEPIEGVSTSTTGFVGMTVRGPTSGLPVLVTSFPEFTRTFGDFLADSTTFHEYRYLSYAVKGFFDNLGQRAYIVRVLGTGSATASDGALAVGEIRTRLTTDVPSNTVVPNATPTIRVVSTHGIDTNAQITLVQVKDGITTTDGPYAVNSYNDTTGDVVLGSPLNNSYESKYTAVQLTVAVAAVTKFSVSAKDPGAWGNQISVQIRASSRVTAQRADDNNLAALSTVPMASTANFYVGAIVEFNTGSKKLWRKVQSISGNSLIVDTPFAAAGDLNVDGGAPAGFTRTLASTCEFDLTASWNGASEQFRSLTMDDTTPYYYGTILADQSNLLAMTTGATADTGNTPFILPAAPDGLTLGLTSGLDGTAAPTPADFIGADNGPGNRTGIQALADREDISIVAVPGVTHVAVQGALITQCETLKYRFAILDPAPHTGGTTPTMDDVQNQRDQFDTKYAAIYYPRIMVYDPLSDGDIVVPPSGHMAGIYARVDNERGVWKAPANEVIGGIDDLEINLSKGDQDILNPEPNNICVLRDFTPQGRGLRVYGARCITSLTEWKYINVRRLFIFLEASLDIGTQWAVFEPNDERLWNRLIQSVSNFLTTVWREGGLMGTKPEEAFFVNCGYDTMTDDDITNGRLIMVVGVAPVFPAEFVIIRIGQWAGGSSVQEL